MLQTAPHIFKAGRGFYEFTKPEVISQKKEVVLLDKATGDMFTGPEALDLIGEFLCTLCLIIIDRYH